jgi:hypothetical protein
MDIKVKSKKLIFIAAGLLALALVLIGVIVYLVSSRIEIQEPQIICETSYDENNNQTYRRLSKADGSVYSTRQAEYDAYSRRTALTIYDGDGKLFYSENVSYDDEGLVTEKLVTTESSYQRTEYEYESGVLLSKSFYDESGNLVKYIRYTADGKALYWEIYEYNAANQILNYWRYTSTRKLDYYREYVYDANGNELRNTRYNADGSTRDWSEYEYDEENRLLCQKQYDTNGKLNTQTDITYTDTGFTVWTYFYKYDNTQSKELSIYDKNGNRTHYEAYPNSYYVSHGNDSTYDDNGNLIEYSEFTYGTTTKWYVYQYDDEGRVTRCDMHGVYERPSAYENTYDAEGNCILRTYYDETGAVTKEVENPSEEISYRYIYRPDY